MRTMPATEGRPSRICAKEQPLVRVLPLAGLLSEALRRNYLRLSVSELFE